MLYEISNQIYLFNLTNMEKLIELLNEYEKGNKTELGTNGYEWCLYRDKLALRNGGVFQIGTFHKIYLVSKEYGFIKWLVDNDKIDKKKLDEVERKPMYVTDDMFSLYKVDECVIMLISISDTPIEDLISYLK